MKMDFQSGEVQGQVSRRREGMQAGGWLEVSPLAICLAYLAFSSLSTALEWPRVCICPTQALLGTSCPLCGATRWVGAVLLGKVDVFTGKPAHIAWLAFVVLNILAPGYGLFRSWCCVRARARRQVGATETGRP
jgi:Protein of unknown function (DUF2752)